MSGMMPGMSAMMAAGMQQQKTNEAISQEQQAYAWQMQMWFSMALQAQQAQAAQQLQAVQQVAQQALLQVQQQQQTVQQAAQQAAQQSASTIQLLQQKQQQQQFSQTKPDTSRSQYSGLISYKRPRNPRDEASKDESEKRIRDGEDSLLSRYSTGDSSSRSDSYGGGTASSSMLVNSALVHKVADTTTHQLLQAATSKSSSSSDKSTALSKSDMVAGGVPHLYSSQYAFAPKTATNLYDTGTAGDSETTSSAPVKLSPESYQSVDDMMKNPFARKVLQVAALSVAEYPDIHSRSPNNLLPNLYKLKTLPDLRAINSDPISSTK
jgi:hypothetical protein